MSKKDNMCLTSNHEKYLFHNEYYVSNWYLVTGIYLVVVYVVPGFES